MTNELENLEIQRRKLSEKISRMRNKSDADAASKLVGKCFKYRNNYSLPEKASDYWWLYRRVVSQKDGYLMIESFQVDKYKKINIEPKQEFHYRHLDSYIEISKAEYAREWKKLLKRINSL